MDRTKVYLHYSFRTTPEHQYTLLARLHLLGFDSFEETDDGWEAYLLLDDSAAGANEELTALQQSIPFSYSIEETPDRNWNEIWEAGFQPIDVEGFCGVRADFHPPMSGVRHEIVINPRMAFGTGHHATTYMMLAAMKDLHLTDQKVLDYGCGTGILSILAAKLGSSEVTAVDIEWDAYDNTIENCRQNEVANVHVLHGTLEQVMASDFNIVLANINRNVILESMAGLHDKLLPGGHLLISGILEQDRELILAKARKHHFDVQNIQDRDGWLAIHLTRD